MPRVLDIESRSEREQLEGGRRRESVDCRLNCTYTRIACSITWASASWTWNTCFNCINIHHYTSLYIFVHHVASLFISTLCSFFVVMQDVSRRYRIRPVNSQHPLFWLFCNNGTKLWDIFLIIKHTHPILLNCQTEQQTQTKHYDGQNALLQCFSTVGPPSTVRHQQGDLTSWASFASHSSSEIEIQPDPDRTVVEVFVACGSWHQETVTGGYRDRPSGAKDGWTGWAKMEQPVRATMSNDRMSHWKGDAACWCMRSLRRNGRSRKNCGQTAVRLGKRPPMI